MTRKKNRRRHLANYHVYYEFIGLYDPPIKVYLTWNETGIWTYKKHKRLMTGDKKNGYPTRRRAEEVIILLEPWAEACLADRNKPLRVEEEAYIIL